MTKSEFEVGLVSALFRGMPELLRGRWIPSPHPEVDVLVDRLDGKVIAVEVTRLHPGGGEAVRKWEAAQRNILARASALYESRGLPGIEVVVFWSAWVDPESNQDRTAQELESFIREHLPGIGEAVGFDIARDEGIILPRAIDSVEIRRLFDGPNHWHGPWFTFPSEITADLVKSRLAAKNLKPRLYKQDYAQRWLVLAVGAEGPSTQGILTKDLQGTDFVSTFDRVFIVTPPASAAELRLSRAV